jgi:phosphoglucosamine mutase
MGELFGTDGIRGRAGEGWLSPEAAEVIGAALGHAMGPSCGTRRGRALLGHDGRRSGPGLEAALAAGLESAGFDCKSAGLFTTPGLALLGRLDDFDVTVMVSASHNPAADNGIKIFGRGGAKLSDEAESAMEAELLQRGCPQPLPGADRPPTLAPDATLEEEYTHYLASSIEDLGLSGLTLVVDCSNGGGSRVAPKVFGRLGAVVHAVAAEPDGDNINAGCGATDLSLVTREVRRLGADLGIALDGDGDRCILVDESGGVVHGDGILTVIAGAAMAAGAWPDPRVVATVMSNKGLHRALRAVGVEVLTVGVGDRNVVAGLREQKLPVGGEQSGHVIFGEDLFHIGDGIYTALRVLQVMRNTSKPLSELAAPYQAFPQILLNVPVAKKPPLGEIPGLADAAAKIEAELGEDGRVLLRYSGTENLARVMVEGPDAARIEEQAGELSGLIQKAIGLAKTQS